MSFQLRKSCASGKGIFWRYNGLAWEVGGESSQGKHQSAQIRRGVTFLEGLLGSSSQGVGQRWPWLATVGAGLFPAPCPAAGDLVCVA